MSDVFWILYRTFFAGLFGLLAGSFLNVCIYRLPRGETIVKGHSYCPHCHHQLSGRDLLPVISYLLLRKRCRYCSQPIAPRYARIESVTGLYFALTVWLWGDGPLAPAQDGIPALLQAWPDPVYNAAVISCVLFAFCALLVWAMILFDRQKPPRAIYAFIAVPALATLALQPISLPLHLAAALFAAAVWWLLRVIGLVPREDRSRTVHTLAGLLLLGLTVGLAAIQPAMAVLLVLVLLRAVWSRRRPNDSERAEQLLYAWPPVILLLGFFAMLLP